MLFLCTAAGWAQGLVKGKVLDKRNSEPLSFVNVKVSQTATGKFVSGGMTDAVGNFNIRDSPTTAILWNLRSWATRPRHASSR